MLPELVEVRIGADAPPDMRATHQRLRGAAPPNNGNGNSNSNRQQRQAEESTQQDNALGELLKLKKLKTLVLKGYGKIEVTSYLDIRRMDLSSRIIA